MAFVLCWLFGHKMEPWKQVGWVPKRVGRRLEFAPNYARSIYCLRCKREGEA